jgi:hypothetical protein
MTEQAKAELAFQKLVEFAKTAGRRQAMVSVSASYLKPKKAASFLNAEACRAALAVRGNDL